MALELKSIIDFNREIIVRTDEKRKSYEENALRIANRIRKKANN